MQITSVGGVVPPGSDSDVGIADECLFDSGAVIPEVYTALAYCAARKAGGTPQEARDVASRASGKAHAYLLANGKLPPNAWVRRVACNEIVDEFRRRGRVRKASRNWLESVLERVAPENTVEVVLRKERIEEVRKAVELLPPKHREVVSMLMGGVTQAAIAERLGLSQGAITLNKTQAFRMLRRSLRGLS